MKQQQVRELFSVVFILVFSLSVKCAYAGFASNTLVRTQTGYTEIAELAVNDYIDGPDCAQRVLTVTRTIVIPFVRIWCADSSIDCAPHQKIYVADRNAWIDASEVHQHNLLQNSAGTLIPVQLVEIVHEPLTVYALSVDGMHMLYVSEQSLLAHNEPFVILSGIASTFASTEVIKTAACLAAVACFEFRHVIKNGIRTVVGWWSKKKKINQNLKSDEHLWSEGDHSFYHEHDAHGIEISGSRLCRFHHPCPAAALFGASPNEIEPTFYTYAESKKGNEKIELLLQRRSEPRELEPRMAVFEKNQNEHAQKNIVPPAKLEMHLSENNQNDDGGQNEPLRPTPPPPPPPTENPEDPEPEVPREPDKELEKYSITDSETFKKAFDFATTESKLGHFFKPKHLFDKLFNVPSKKFYAPIQIEFVKRVLQRLLNTRNYLFEGAYDEVNIVLDEISITVEFFMQEGIIKIRTMYIPKELLSEALKKLL